MIHRAPFGSMERFIGVLIEHFAGAFPLWLAPEQVRVLTVSEKSEAYGREVEAAAQRRRAPRDRRLPRHKLNAKIREAQVELIPYMFVVGEKDRDAGTVAVRDRLEGDLGPMPLDAAIAKLRDEIDAKTVRQVAARQAGRGWPTAAQSERVLTRSSTAVADSTSRSQLIACPQLRLVPDS